MSPRVKKAGAAILTATTLLLPFYPVLAAQIIPEIQPLNKPFGGKITKIQACQSPKGLLLTIGPPTNGKFLLTNSSTIHAYGNVMPGIWTLGLADPTPVNCRGNPSGIGGFSVGGLVGDALSGGSLSVLPVYGEGILGTTLAGADIVGPLGPMFSVTGPLAETLVGLSESGALSVIGPAISGDIFGVISSIFGDSFLSTIGLFDPTGITQIISLAFTVFSFIFPKKPPSLGDGYPIIRIGTGPAPAPNFTPPILTPI